MLPRLQSAKSISARPRDVWVDYLKAAAIVGVVCIHAGTPADEVLRFGVPVFVGLWAFYLETSLARLPVADHPADLRRRLFELAVPYLAWTFFYIALFYLPAFRSTPWHTIVGAWFGGYGWSGQYFFVVLIQIGVLTPLVRRLATPRAVMPIIVLGILFNALAGYVLFGNRWVSALGDRLFIYWVPYVLLGIALARGQIKGAPAFVLPALALLAVAPIEATMLAAKSPYLVVSVMVASLLLMAAAVSADRQARENNRSVQGRNFIGRISAYIGQNTFVIFVANVLMLEGARSIGLVAATKQFGSIGVVVVVVPVIAACLCLGVMFQRLGLGLLVGKPVRTRGSLHGGRKS